MQTITIRSLTGHEIEREYAGQVKVGNGAVVHIAYTDDHTRKYAGYGAVAICGAGAAYVAGRRPSRLTKIDAPTTCKTCLKALVAGPR
jgi:hypothetical protein